VRISCCMGVGSVAGGTRTSMRISIGLSCDG
jgi:hypothetical protein